MKYSLPNLPIVEHLDQIAHGIQSHLVSILQAPPGSGKTTILPLYLANQPWLLNRKILILQPRRLAAKSVASRMSEILGSEVGKDVGYQIRLERKVSPHTRIEVITEGLLTRRIIADPELRDVGLIIFDEFHERSLNADIGLVLSQEIGSVLRPDLRILIMSATLDSLADVPSLSSAWRYTFNAKPYPVEIKYSSCDPRVPVWEQVASTVRSALAKFPGDLLAFLPGAYEIDRCFEILSRLTVDATVMPLYGDLAYAKQQAALRPLPNNARKVVLATNIAETSLTIDGVQIVVDSGLQKISRSGETGISSLKTTSITRDAADQRAGRAGRTGPGVCIRLWSEQEHLALRPNREPEILRADITQQILELAAWGTKDPHTFAWITPPADHAISNAQNLLRSIRAVDSNGVITNRGKLLVKLGADPRLGVCCLAARDWGLEMQAAALIAILEERFITKTDQRQADISTNVESLASSSRTSAAPNRLQELSDRWAKRILALPRQDNAKPPRIEQSMACGLLLATAFPDRIAKRREDSHLRYLLSSGIGATLNENDPLGAHEYIVVAELRERAGDAQVIRAAPLNPKLFETHLKEYINEVRETKFDSELGVMLAFRRQVIGAVTIKEDRISDLSQEDLQSALVEYIRTNDGFCRLPFSAATLSTQSRALWARKIADKSNIPDLSPEALRLSNPCWLEPYLPKSGRFDSINSETIESALNGLISWEQKRELNEIAPEAITLPNGKSRRIDYAELGEPLVEATIQELFGLSETPKIGRYHVPLTLRLLSPAKRPIQVTRDLVGFWTGSYKEIRKELRGRYPKHKWPEDPKQL